MHCMNGMSPRQIIPLYIYMSLTNKYLCILVPFLFRSSSTEGIIRNPSPSLPNQVSRRFSVTRILFSREIIISLKRILKEKKKEKRKEKKEVNICNIAACSRLWSNYICSLSELTSWYVSLSEMYHYFRHTLKTDYLIVTQKVQKNAYLLGHKHTVFKFNPFCQAAKLHLNNS